MPARRKKKVAPKAGKRAGQGGRPPHLVRGRTAALVAPAFTFDAQLMEQGRAVLETKYGLKTVALPSVSETHAYFAGSDERRLAELESFLTDPGVDALIAIRGGYGCARIYEGLRDRLRKKKKLLRPKLVVGYSDVTILLNGLHQDFGWTTFHGPVLVGRPFRTPVPIEETTIAKALFSAEPLGPITDPAMGVLQHGRASGPIVGGCLSLVVSTLGTSYELDTRGKVLFLEDVDEKPYRLDRMLTQLVQAGKLDHVKALVFGQMVGCEPGPDTRDPNKTSSLEAIRLAVGAQLARRHIPAVFNFPAGHGMPQIVFPIGARVEVRADKDRPSVVFLEAGTR